MTDSVFPNRVPQEPTNGIYTFVFFSDIHLNGTPSRFVEASNLNQALNCFSQGHSVWPKGTSVAGQVIEAPMLVLIAGAGAMLRISDPAARQLTIEPKDTFTIDARPLR